MRKLTFCLAFLLLLFSASNVGAALIEITKDGEISWNVLSSEAIALEVPKRASLEVKDVAEDRYPDPETKVTMIRDNDRIEMNIATREGERIRDVTNYQDDLIEIEERGEVATFKIRIVEEKFIIEQQGVLAITEFPINIDARKAEVSVVTPSGQRYLAVLPREAVNSAFRAKAVTKLPAGQEIILDEGSSGELSYIISGERVINLLNLFDFGIPVTAFVSATTGEVLSVDQPTWLRILGFLFE